MLNQYSIVFLSVFSFAFICTIAYSIIKIHISQKYFNKNCLRLYEQSLENYSFCMDDNVDQIAQKMNKRIQYKRIKAEAYIDEQNPNVINVNESLSDEQKNFAITHELGHILRGYDSRAARNRKNIFSRLSPEEQICDYYAAAILLPKDDLKRKMDEANYNKLNEDSQADFVKKIADEKCIVDDVVYRRIDEINLLYS